MFPTTTPPGVSSLDRTDRLVPPGFSLCRELGLAAIFVSCAAAVLLLGYVTAFMNARYSMVNSHSFEHFPGCVEMLMPGVIAFGVASAAFVWMFFRYLSYLYRGGSRAIYTMRRLRRRLEPVVRCCTIPVLGLLACQLLWRGLALVLGAGYMRAVPAEYIPPGAWEELIHLLTH